MNNIPQIILLIVLLYALFEYWSNRGQMIKVSFWGEVLEVLALVALLFWGGFFNSLLGIGG